MEGKKQQYKEFAVICNEYEQNVTKKTAKSWKKKYSEMLKKGEKSGDHVGLKW